MQRRRGRLYKMGPGSITGTVPCHNKTQNPQSFFVHRKKKEPMAQSSSASVKLLVLVVLPALLLLLVQAQGARPAAANATTPTPTTTTGCAASSVTVSQSNTGDRAGYDPVFEVTVRNACRCAVRAVRLRSEGFASSVPVDPRLFRRAGRDYLVADGRRIEPGADARFRYAWDRAFRMTAAAVRDDCS
ncbi:hypothetical protein Zm00014a_030084 [Zea mays]|uniref:Uncharacterized protein n=1 Tax=Zea mays TaxID=4577 RepID=A0A3L6F4A9_MAIZE|nr:hypothetical protein Zm00014a_030084 [Zea mays]